jgi:hypothetical protein
MKKGYWEICISGTKTWVDQNGHKRRKTKKFWQTVNPYNKNDDGSPKTGKQIYKELCLEMDEWLNASEMVKENGGQE